MQMGRTAIKSSNQQWRSLCVEDEMKKWLCIQMKWYLFVSSIKGVFKCVNVKETERQLNWKKWMSKINEM